MKKLFAILSIICVLFLTPHTYANDVAELTFGTTQFVACTTGIQDQSNLPMGIWINLNPDWRIKQVDLTWTASDGSQGIGIIPVTQDINEIPMYPAIYKLTQNTHPITFFVNGTITACFDTTCQKYPLSLDTTVPNTFALHTPDCASILFALSHAPKHPHIHISQQRKFFILFLLFLCYIFISPLLMIWGCHWQKNESLFKKFCRYIQLILVFSMVIGTISAFWPNLWTSTPIGKVGSILLILIALLWARSSPFITLCTLILMPKPGFDILQSYSIMNRIIFIDLFAFIWILLFQLQYTKAKSIYRFFKQWHKRSPQGIRLTFSLPWLLLLLYTLIYL